MSATKITRDTLEADYARLREALVELWAWTQADRGRGTPEFFGATRPIRKLAYDQVEAALSASLPTTPEPPLGDGIQRLNRPAYEKLIAEDLEWLLAQPRSLERDHIELIVQRSPVQEYGAFPAPIPCWICGKPKGAPGCVGHYETPPDTRSWTPPREITLNAHSYVLKDSNEGGDTNCTMPGALSQAREAVAWAYQFAAARGATVQELDNLSAVAQGQPPPHEWSVVSPDPEALTLSEREMAPVWLVEAWHQGCSEGYWTAPAKGIGGWITENAHEAKRYTKAEAKAVAAALDYFPTPHNWSRWEAHEHVFVDAPPHETAGTPEPGIICAYCDHEAHGNDMCNFLIRDDPGRMAK